MSRISKVLAIVACVAAICFTSAVAFAGEIDILVQKLVDKGVLSHGEAQQILTETKEEVRVEIAKGTYSSLPMWLQKMKLKGDFRLRYQYDHKDMKNREVRHRGRFRYRLGIKTKINDKVTVAAGLASGGADPRSTNQSFDNTFSTKAINLDYAYVKYDPTAWATLYGGKFKRKPVLWEPTDLLWDGDINPEGASITLRKKIDSAKLFFNTGIWVLEQFSSTSNDPWMVYVQPGFKWRAKDKSVELKAANTFYWIDVDNRALTWNAGTNTMIGGVYPENFACISPAVQLSFKEPFGGLVPYLSFFGEYVHNSNADKIRNTTSNNENGWAAGLKFGDKKIKKANQWQLKYIYRYLQRDAWLDSFPDSDAYDGDTSIKGHEVALKYGLGKNVTLGLDYYYTKPIKVLPGVSDHSKGSGNYQHLFQVDLLCKF